MNDLIFSWAEDADGKMVHVDSVRQGLSCGCSCPYCHERLMARHEKSGLMVSLIAVINAVPILRFATWS